MPRDVGSTVATLRGVVDWARIPRLTHHTPARDAPGAPRPGIHAHNPGGVVDWARIPRLTHHTPARDAPSDHRRPATRHPRSQPRGCGRLGAHTAPNPPHPG